MLKYLVIFAVLAVALLVIARLGAGTRISGGEARALVADGALLVDVRTPAEYRSGHIEGAVNIPLQEIDGRLDDFGSKEEPIVLYCRSGARSGKARSILQGAGYTKVHNLGPKTAW